MKNIKVSLVQTDLVWENKAANLINIEKVLSGLYGLTDMVILPEMFTTGFSMEAVKLAESPMGETYKWMKEQALKGNFGLCGTYIINDEGRFFNRFVFVTPSQEHWHYDKRHLFSIGGEDKYFHAGNKKLVFSFRDVRISPYICYDLRFPVWSRNRNEFDLMIYSSNWPASRSEVWNTLLKARAMENQCYVAGVNRTGTDGNGILYCGDSKLIDPRGNIVVEADTEHESAITGDILLTELLEFRKKFPVLRDADDFSVSV